LQTRTDAELNKKNRVSFSLKIWLDLTNRFVVYQSGKRLSSEQQRFDLQGYPI